MAIRNLIGDITENSLIKPINILAHHPSASLDEWTFNDYKVTEVVIAYPAARVTFFEEEPTYGGKFRRKYSVPLNACVIISANEFVEEADGE